MTDVDIEAVWTFVLSWRTPVVILLLGVMPGVCTRLIVLAYPRGDERRDEIIAELYSVPFHARLLWVAQHVERAFSEGLPARRRSRAALAKRQPPAEQSETNDPRHPDADGKLPLPREVAVFLVIATCTAFGAAAAVAMVVVMSISAAAAAGVVVVPLVWLWRLMPADLSDLRRLVPTLRQMHR